LELDPYGRPGLGCQRGTLALPDRGRYGAEAEVVAGGEQVESQAVRNAGAGVAALQRATLVLAHAAPDAVVLSRLQRPGETLLLDVAATAHLLGLLDLEDGRTGVADRKNSSGSSSRQAER
jgi:hypothetical protein